MAQRLDCLVIGYHDVPFSRHEERVMAREPDFPDRRIFMRDHVTVDGHRLPYMDVINHFVNRTNNRPDTDYYHVGEVANLAAVYLTSYLAKHGCSAQFTSLFTPERQRIAAILQAEDPRAVAITTTFYLTPSPVVEIVRYIREHNPRTTVVVGGPLVDNLTTDLDHDTLVDVFAWMDADVYVRDSQGEQTLYRIVESLRQGRELTAVPNCYVRSGGGGGSGSRFEFTRRVPEDTPVDDGMIDWNLFDDADVGLTAQTRTARSCAFKCSFCDFPARAGALSLASIEAVEAELALLADRGVKHVVFIDDTFNVPQHRFKDLCRMMIRNDFDFRWYSFFRASSARDDETYDLAARSGCAAVFLGIESADDGVLKLMQKSATAAAYRTSIERLHERGITTFASFVVGFPGETGQTLRNTIDFLNESAPSFYRAEPWWYNHRSPIHARASELGIHGQGYQWRHGTMDIQGACDGLDAIFEGVSGSTWIPTYNFDFWALPYLFGKGFTLAQTTGFLERAQRLMKWNADPGAPAGQAAAIELAEWFRDITVAPAKYRTQAGLEASGAGAAHGH